MSAVKSGDNFKIYIDTADNYSTPTWSLLTLADDSLQMPRNKISIPIKKRGASDVMYLPGQRDRAFSFGVFYDPTASSDYDRLRDAEEANSQIHIAIADGPIATAGTVYYHAWFYVSGFDDSRDLDNGAMAEVELRLAEDHAAGEVPAEVTVV